ncbi:MAG TPA: hypothetical protein VLT33_14285, partial [Labilithrix sp.]|nr:hypothetical protein [Labilithrix sp.]
MNLLVKASVLGLVTAALLAGVGCSAAPEEEGTGDDDVVTGASTPPQNSIVFEQVKTCDNLFKDRAAFRDVDLQEGVLRWKCGDVDGVSISKCEDDLALLAAEEAKGSVTTERRQALSQCGNGYGQEYCEYNAVAKGNVVNGVKSAKDLKDADVVQCVFTSVHSDFKGKLANTEAFADDLSSKLKPQLVAAGRIPEGRVSGMKQGVNSRGAADTLINDCANLAKGGETSYAKDADRQVLCYNAWAKATTPADKAKYETACKGIDLSNDTAWAKTGIKATELTDADHDLASCTMVLHAKNGGVSWRNSDPTICARSYRAARECNVDFKQIGAVAPTFAGFSMQGWTNRDTLPTGCKYATLAESPYANVVICTAGAQDVKNYRTQKKPLQTLCRDKFGVNVAMQAPIGA